MRTLPAPARTAAEGFFTTIRRTPDGELQAVPYSLEYQGELERAAARLRDAARLTQQPTLRAFLEARAAAFLSNDYYDSDVAWMKLDASIEPTIGPYEVYEDGWFSAKAAFEAYVSVRDDAETTKLAKLAGELQDDRKQPADRRQAAQSEARRGGADPRRQPALQRGRREQGGAGGRLQPPQRRTHHQAGRQQAHAHQERPARQVRPRPDADQPDRARPRRSDGRRRSTRSSPTS